jgi:hypothetical protein
MCPAALLHFSEDPTITCFHPRPMATRPGEPPRVWAIDEEHAFLYYFPRDCPRIAFWALPESNPDDIARYLGHTAARQVVAIESAWLERLLAGRLYVYRLPGQTFECIEAAIGHHVSHAAVAPISMEPLDHLLDRLVDAGCEVRVTPSLWPLRRALLSATLHYSMIRMRNAQPEMTV